MPATRIVICLFVLGALGTLITGRSGPAPSPPQELDTVTWSQVRGVLEARCLECHGGEDRQSGLSFASRATFLEGGDRGALLDADEPAGSRLLAVVSYANPELAMPPPGKLPQEELELLSRWVHAGAGWPEGEPGRLADPERFSAHASPAGSGEAEHAGWAWRPLVAPAVPPAFEGQKSHAIDRFLAARRAPTGLTVAPAAEPADLVRRASFDLIGLPPTPLEVDTFTARVAAVGLDLAWEELLERLLASPHHGEHWGRHWLDVVRYAETNGYERDGTKTNMWRYRDWVIRALNADLPYDRFLIEQLAGDELPVVSEEEQADVLLATGYYRLGVWDDEPSDPVQARADELADIVDTTAQAFLGTTFGCARCHDHKADPISQRDYYALTAYFNNLTGYGGEGFGQHLGGGMTRDLADRPRPGVPTLAERDAELERIERELRPYAEELGVSTEPAPARVLVADARVDARDGQTLWRHSSDPAPDGWTRPGFDDSAWSEAPGGFGRAGTPGALIGTPWLEERLQLRTRFALTELPTELVLSFHHDEDLAVWLNGQPIFERAGYRGDYAEVQLGPEALAALVVGSNVLAVACRQSGGGQYVDVGLRTGLAVADPHAWLQRLAVAMAAATGRPGAGEVQSRLERRRRLLEGPVARPYPALVVAERGARADAQHVLLRGNAHAPGEAVEPGVPAIFLRAAGTGARGPSLPEFDGTAGSTGRRLALAQWLVGEGRFLTARVMANRLWQFHFGRGLCRSPGDFGGFGVPPTHPELLDHLACELIANNWSLKHMHRYLMRTAAYRMSSVPDAKALEEDPRNELYARFDPRRLSAEEYRDAVLTVSGELNPELFGRSVFPPLPAEVLATASRPGQAWGAATPEEAARRSIYVFVKRSLRHPLLEALDQPDPDLPCPERYPTNVPTQALMTLNGAFTRAAARTLAERLRAEESGAGPQIERGIRLAYGRAPRPGEAARGLAFLERTREAYGLDDLEALELFCLGLFNRNEFLWVN